MSADPPAPVVSLPVRTSHPAGSAEITLIRKAGPSPVMSKRISIDVRGGLHSDGSACLMVDGTAIRAPAETASLLANYIRQCGPDQAIALGALRAELPDTVAVTTLGRMKAQSGAISRSRTFIDYRRGSPAWVLIDFDAKGMPADVAAAIQLAGGMWNALLTVAPGLKPVSRVSRASTSAGLFRMDTGVPCEGSGGSHHYILLQDGGDAERFLRDLHDRCWLGGFGWHIIGRAGQLLERSVVDRMVGYGERLCFEGAPLLVPPLEQDASKRIPQVFEGERIDGEVVAPRLTEYERHLVAEAKAASAAALEKIAAEVRVEHDSKLAEKISIKFGLPRISAMRLVVARHRGVLLPYIELDFDHLGMVPVADVLTDPDRFVGETLADPLEGAEYGRCKAMVMKGGDGGLFIHSFAHGRSIYSLRYDLRAAKVAVAQAPTGAVVDHAMAVLKASEMEPDEVAEYAATVASAANVSVRGVTQRATKVRRDQEEAARRATIASQPDGRTIRPRPEPDGELLPVVTFLDDLLASDQREEPAMRDASGNLVEVRVREPWDLHLLTADGTNAADGPLMKAPPEPGLVQLTPTCIELLIERRIRWSVQTERKSYYAALPRPYIDALMQLSPSAIPVARAINTAPLVSLSGKIIEGAGLDRATGLVHRIDPTLRACMPEKAPTVQDVVDAMTFLHDEWLVDVSLDRTGKNIVIMMAMTLIERALLPERPAFFVTAGQRGGGKTTLVNMVVLATFGRRAAAAAWSDKVEERKKALFSYLRQGVAALVWDNIARGSSLSCPHIEAALTAPETSDRVLGVSRVEAVPSTTVHIFTGNAITPRGDMASRSFMLGLNVDRPDPENRTFKHSDPIAWTRQHRPRIVRALYTLLVAGALNRNDRSEAPKTRFKTWWKLVGWAMEYAAGLAGTPLDCTKLLLSGETEDEDAAGASAALNLLLEIFGTDRFTSKDVVGAISLQPNQGDILKPAAELGGRGAALAEAVRELTERRSETPTARSLGKLFQKRLVGRPTWIGEGRRVATLLKSSGHSENTYRVQLTPSAVTGAAVGENIPRIPDIPTEQSVG